MGSRRKARECALQMLFAADFAEAVPEEVLKTYWVELGDSDVEETAREFATRLAAGTLSRLETLDERIRSRAEHWRIPRMAIVDRNILRLAVERNSSTNPLHAPSPSTKRLKSPAVSQPTKLRSLSTAFSTPLSATLMSNSLRSTSNLKKLSRLKTMSRKKR